MRKRKFMLCAIVALFALSGTYLKNKTCVATNNSLLLENIEALTTDAEFELVWRGVKNDAVCPGKYEEIVETVNVTVDAGMASILAAKGIPFTVNSNGTITYSKTTKKQGPVYHVVCTEGSGLCWGTDC